MKHIITAVVSASLVALIVIAVLTVNVRQQKETEVRESLESTVYSTIDNVMSEKNYTAMDNDEFVNDFYERLMANIQTGTEKENDPNLALTVNVLQSDFEKGFICVHVTEEFSYPLFGTGETQCTATAVYDVENGKQTYSIYYYTDHNTLADGYVDYEGTVHSQAVAFSNGETVGKQYIIQTGSPMKIPEEDAKCLTCYSYFGYTFLGWTDGTTNSSGYPVLTKIPDTADESGEYYAVYKKE